MSLYSDTPEPTFYKWLKDKPKLTDSIKEGYKYSKLKEVIFILSMMPNAYGEHWLTNEFMTYPDGKQI